MSAPIPQGNAPPPPPINWATKPQPTASLQDDVAGSGIPIRRLVPVFVNPDSLSDFQEALRLVSQPTHQQSMPDPQDDVIVDMSNLQMLLCHLCHQTSQQSRSEVHADACLNKCDPTSDCQGLTSAFLCLSTLANTSPVHLLAARTLPRVSTHSNLSQPANTTVLTSDAPSCPLGVRTALVLLTPANTAASTSNAPSHPIGVRTSPVPPITLLQASPRKKKYYVIIVGKCTGIYYDHW